MVTTVQGLGQTVPVRKTVMHTPSSVQFAGVRDVFSRSKPETVSASLLEEPPLQKEFVRQMRQILVSYPRSLAVRNDFTKTPPLELLKALTDANIFVVGVPIPSATLGRPLVNHPDVLPFIDESQQQALKTMFDNPEKTNQDNQYVRYLGKEGYGRAMLLASIEIPRQSAAGVATFMGVSSGLAAETLTKMATPEQQSFWLNALNKGVFTYAFGLTEEQGGSDPRSIKTTFKKETDEKGNVVYRLSGNKAYIGNMAKVVDESTGKVIHPGADFIQIFAVDDPNKSPEQRSFRAFMVPRELLEDTITPSGGELGKMGMREVNNGNTRFKDIIVPEVFLLGDPEVNIYPNLLSGLDETRLMVAGMSLGTAEAAVDMAKSRAAERVVYNNPIEKFQAIGFPLKDYEAKLLATRLLVMECARLVDKSAEQAKLQEQDPSRKAEKIYFRTETSMAKLFASELAYDAVDQAIQTYGGYGYMEESELPKLARDARVLRIYEGTSEIQKNVIVQGVLITEGKEIAKSLLKQIDMKLGSPALRGKAFLGSLKGTPTEQVESIYKRTVADVLPDYYSEMTQVKKMVRQKKKEYEDNGTDHPMLAWDKKSLDREAELIAMLPMQRRLHLMAEIATWRKMTQLADKELTILNQVKSPSVTDSQRKSQLTLFTQLARDAVHAKYAELHGDALATKEKEYRQSVYRPIEQIENIGQPDRPNPKITDAFADVD